MSRVNVVLDRAKGVMSGFTTGQRSVVVVVGLALILGAFALSRWLAQPSWAPLYGNLSGTDANAVVEQLTADGVSYKLTGGGGTVLVPADQVYNLRVELSGKGLPANDAEGGWSLLDKQGITATDFQQNVAYRRALEGELAKTLEAMDGVNTAVVHLAIPQKDVFSTETDKTTASVLLSLAPGTDLTGDQISAITHLVGGSVEGLDPAQVTVTDQSGQLLSGAGGSGSASGAGAADEQTAAFENRMDTAVQKVLDQIVGPGHSVVRVNAQLNFDDTQSTSETYAQATPTPPPLSEATVQEQYGGGSGTGSGGTLGQIIPTPVSSAASGSGSYSRSQTTVNNSVDKTVSKTSTAPGQVRRMTVAVVLDAKTAGTLDTTRVQQLVANAVGLDPSRGDAVQVDALPFDGTAAATANAQIAQADKAAKTAQYLDLAKKAGLGLLVLIVLIMLMRGRKKDDDATIQAMASDLPGGMLMASSPMAVESGEQLAIGASAPAAGQQQMREEVAALVDNQPEDVAQMLQGWLAERK